MNEKIIISFSGMDATDALKKYTFDKFSKHEYLFDIVTSLEIVLTQHVTHRGVSKDFQLVATAKVPKSLIRVEEVGGDMYAVIDTASDKLFRRLKRYHDKLSQWEGTKAWDVKDVDPGEYFEEEELASYAEYVPNIVERSTMEYMTPMEEAEAVERMELLGRNQLLFKNSNTGSYSMVYKVERGGYGIKDVGNEIG